MNATLPSRRRRALLLVLMLSVMLNGFEVWWGLPNLDTTWAADAITPLTPLSVAHKSFAHRNSGWFYFKYPIGHPLLLLAAYTPYLTFASATGALHHPQAQYPYGFRHPQRALTVLALIGRAVSVAMAAGIVWCVSAIGSVLFDETTGVLAAAVAACSVVLVFYGHTTNLDVPVTFWMLLAVLCALRLMDAVHWRDCLGLGGAAAMGLATKESAVGFLVLLPLLIVGAQLRRLRALERGAWKPVVFRLAAGAGFSLLLYGMATNAFYNPAGLYNRVLYLTNRLPAAAYGTLVPRAAYTAMAEHTTLATHLRLLRQLGRCLAESVGPPLFVVGLAGIAVGLQRRRPAALLLLALSAAYYWFALAALPLVAIRYVLPLSMLLAVFAGVCLSALLRRGAAGRAVTALLLLSGLAYGASVDYLLLHDPRYQAEAWLRQHADGRVVETYSRATFLPRMPPDVKLSQPALDAITLSGLAQRRPDFILLSIPDLNRAIGRYDTSVAKVDRRPANEAFLQALLAGKTDYHSVARFRARSPLLPDGVIRSLNPEIVVFARS